MEIYAGCVRTLFKCLHNTTQSLFNLQVFAGNVGIRKDQAKSNSQLVKLLQEDDLVPRWSGKSVLVAGTESCARYSCVDMSSIAELPVLPEPVVPAPHLAGLSWPHFFCRFKAPCSWPRVAAAAMHGCSVSGAMTEKKARNIFFLNDYLEAKEKEIQLAGRCFQRPAATRRRCQGKRTLSKLNPKLGQACAWPGASQKVEGKPLAKRHLKGKNGAAYRQRLRVDGVFMTQHMVLCKKRAKMHSKWLWELCKRCVAQAPRRQKRQSEGRLIQRGTSSRTACLVVRMSAQTQSSSTQTQHAQHECWRRGEDLWKCAGQLVQHAVMAQRCGNCAPA